MRLAIFDLDGTVLRGNSWQTFYWWSLRHWPHRAPALLGRLLLRRAGVVSAAALRRAALRSLKGLNAAEVGQIGQRIFDRELQRMIRAAAREEMARRRHQGFEIVLATAAFDFLAAPVAAELDIGHVVASTTAYVGMTCEGRMIAPEPRGLAKADAVRARFASKPIDWQASCAFTDEVEDAPLLSLVGEPIYVGARFAGLRALPAEVRIEDWNRT